MSSPTTSDTTPAAPPPGPTTNVNLFAPEFAMNPLKAHELIRADGPVVRHQLLTGMGVIVSGYEEVLYAMRHPEIYSSAAEAVSIGQQRPMIPLQIDPPDHVKYRKLLDPVFSYKNMRALEPEFRKLAADLIDKFADKGECDFNQDFAVMLPSIMFLSLVGLPIADLDKFIAIKDGIIRPSSDDPDEQTKQRDQAGKDLYEYFGTELDAREKAPKDDILSWMQTAEVDREKLTRDQILDICYLLLIAGLDTVTASLDCFVYYLARHPEQRQRLIDDPALYDNAIEEMLRVESPVQMVVRILAQDTTLAGVELKKGEHVTLLIAAANDHVAEFDSPEVMDFDRERNRHLAFGGGNHRCLGSHLARMELRVALEEFHRRVPQYEIKPGAEIVFTPGIRQAETLPLVFGREA